MVLLQALLQNNTMWPSRPHYGSRGFSTPGPIATICFLTTLYTYGNISSDTVLNARSLMVHNRSSRAASSRCLSHCAYFRSQKRWLRASALSSVCVVSGSSPFARICPTETLLPCPTLPSPFH
jgi:hypothetical protein